MRPGVSLFTRFPEIEQSPIIKRALTSTQTCMYCTKFPPEEKNFFCPDRNKTVTRKTALRIYCFKPLTDSEFSIRQDRARALKSAKCAAWNREHPAYYRDMKRRHREANLFAKKFWSLMAKHNHKVPRNPRKSLQKGRVPFDPTGYSDNIRDKYLFKKGRLS